MINNKVSVTLVLYVVKKIGGKESVRHQTRVSRRSEFRKTQETIAGLRRSVQGKLKSAGKLSSDSK